MTTVATRGLGKGLSALIPEHYDSDESANSNARSGLEQVAIDLLFAGSFQPRRDFDETALDELADSIRNNGIMQPIIVRRSESRYEIIAGERRWRAARRAGLADVPVLVRQLTDRQAQEIALIENVQRQDLNPLEEAEGYRKLMDQFSYTQEELSKALGKSRSHIANLLRLLGLPNEVKQMLSTRQLSMGHARALLNTDKPVEMAQEIIRRGLNVRQTERLSRGDKPAQAKAGRAGAAPQTGSFERAPKDPDILALEETLSENLGLNVSINDLGEQRGNIVIGYETLEQLDEVLRRLGGSI